MSEASFLGVKCHYRTLELTVHIAFFLFRVICIRMRCTQLNYVEETVVERFHIISQAASQIHAANPFHPLGLKILPRNGQYGVIPY
jgi:hypothetical protein